ncbi:hypothetical protein ElyMa_000631300 [Elysia marginata]|uniref:Uncharacterized protein n=1 Tax=Elysia marginata TaxID=1093978 RepID=A0AAV4GDA9_9GAST|nr:hypothetical protein ElyMa_000631300 [Elysia marginata]
MAKSDEDTDPAAMVLIPVVRQGLVDVAVVVVIVISVQVVVEVVEVEVVMVMEVILSSAPNLTALGIKDSKP